MFACEYVIPCEVRLAVGRPPSLGDSALCLYISVPYAELHVDLLGKKKVVFTKSSYELTIFSGVAAHEALLESVFKWFGFTNLAQIAALDGQI